MASRFLLQIVRRDGTIVQFEPGLTAELDFVESIVQDTLRRGVGFLKTSAHVEQDLRDAIEAVILGLKSKIQPE